MTEVETKIVLPPITYQPRQVGEMVVIPPSSPTPMQLIDSALKSGATIEQMQQLMELSERWEKNNARKAFVAAMAEFKLNAPEIFKSKKVGFDSKKTGDRTSYSHADLGEICAAAIPLLAKVGISHAWSYDQTAGVKVTCTLTHSQGHSEPTTLTAPPDNTGNKNNIQMIGSTIRYLERYTLLGACGLASKDMDDDGRDSEPGPDTLSEEQVANIQALLTEVGGNLLKFLATYKVNAISDLRSKDYDSIVKVIERKRRQPPPSERGTQK